MKIKILAILFVILSLIITFTNPTFNYSVSQDTLNEHIKKSTPIKRTFKGEHDIILKNANIIFRRDLKAEIDLDADLETNILGKKRKANFKGIMASGLSYDNGAFYLDEPRIEEIKEITLHLNEDDNLLMDAVSDELNIGSLKSKLGNIAEKKIFKNKKDEIKEKAKELATDAIEQVPVYKFNFGGFKNDFLKEAVGNIKIKENKIVLILKPMTMFVKFVLIGTIVSIFFIILALNINLKTNRREKEND